MKKMKIEKYTKYADGIKPYCHFCTAKAVYCILTREGKEIGVPLCDQCMNEIYTAIEEKRREW